jgi:hypothetical protein
MLNLVNYKKGGKYDEESKSLENEYCGLVLYECKLPLPYVFIWEPRYLYTSIILVYIEEHGATKSNYRE